MSGWGSKASLGRPGEPSEVATSFVFLASPDSSFYCKPSFSFRRSISLTNYTDGQVLHCYPLGD